MDKSTSPIFERSIDALIRQISLAEARATHELELTELSMKQVVYLETIARLGRPTFSELARELKVTKPSVSAIYRKLESHGFVSREASSEDRRSFHIILTDRGRELQTAHENLHRKIAEHIAHFLTQEEQADLTRLLDKVLANI